MRKCIVYFLSLLLFVVVFSVAEKPKMFSNAVPFRKIKGRIIGGEVAAVGQFPYQASLFITISGNLIFCGGSLITTTHILTAGHCTVYAEGVLAYLGTVIPQDFESKAYTGKRITTHPSFSEVTLENDIGLIELSSVVVLTNNVQTIPLDFSTVEENTVVTISGFGKTSEDGGISNVLRFATLTTITNEECDLTYVAVSSSVICAKGTDVQSACNGDSGGPLTRTNGSKVVQVGVVSFVYVEGCALMKPTGFTRVSEYKNFIESVLTSRNSSTNFKMFYVFEVFILCTVYFINQ